MKTDPRGTDRNGDSDARAEDSPRTAEPRTDPEWNRFLATVQRCLTQAERAGELVAVHVVSLRALHPLTFGRTPEATKRLMAAVANEFSRSLRDGDLIVPLDRSRFCLLQRNADSIGSVRTVAAKLSQVAVALTDELGADACAVGTALSDAADNGIAFIGQAAAAAERAIRLGEPYHLAETRSRSVAVGVSDARMAIELGEFKLLLQPQIDLSRGLPTAVEVLARMQHPSRGLLTPRHFLPAIERAGLQTDFDLWILEEACRMRRETRLPKSVRMAVNVHPQLLDLPDLPAQLERVLIRNSVLPSQLELELLEFDGLDEATTSNRVAAIRHLGVGLVLDDFGTGYSSFERVVHHPFDKIKLPRELTQHVGTARGDAAVCSVLRFCREVELETTAEGIETAGQRDRLCSWACDNGQGFLLGRPMSRAELEAAVA